MNFTDLEDSVRPNVVGEEMHTLIKELFPLCRSITGDGVRETLRRIQRIVPLQIHEVPTGTQVFDWTIPKEWNIRDAYVKDDTGRRVIDFQKSNLHVMSYSVPVRKTVSIDELKKHIFSLPEHPDWIPYRTSYYDENWAFCLSQNEALALSDSKYEVHIDSSLENGHLSYGEYYLPGSCEEEVLLSCHVCHPSLANDNLSGIAVTTFLAKYLASQKTRYSYRFLFLPGTIGSIAWLSLNENKVSNIKHGVVVACVGDAGRFTYKKSRRGDAEIDMTMAHLLKHCGEDYTILDFSPYGYDERQYCSPGFNLPVGSLTRTPHGQFSEYHTSADNPAFVLPNSLAESFLMYVKLAFVLDNNRTYQSLNPKCEPQLGRRGLYDSIGGGTDGRDRQLVMLWTLNFSDGRHTLLDIAEKSGFAFDIVFQVANVLSAHGLLQEIRE